MGFIRKEWKDLYVQNREGTTGISFEKVINAMNNGGLIYNGPNDTPQYPGQQMYIVNVDGYPIKVPYKKTGIDIELITAYPSRKFKHLLP